MRLILADDHALVRAGMRRLLEDMPEVSVVAEADNGLDVAGLVAEHQPDALILDLSMPGLNGIEVAQLMAAEHPGLPILIVSMHTNAAYVRKALEVGVRGFMIKSSAPAELAHALRAVADGKRYVAPDLAAELLLGEEKPANAENPFPDLTRRQQTVLQLMARGLSTKQIAGELEISAKTVETHRARIMERLGFASSRQLTRFAIETVARHDGI